MATYPINDENPPTGAGYRPGDIVVCPPGSVVPRWKYVGDEQWVPANVVEFVENEVTGGIKLSVAETRPRTVVIDGDSIGAQGYTDSAVAIKYSNHGWWVHALYKMKWPLKVAAVSAVSGQTSSQILDRFDSTVAPHKPDEVWAIIGQNNLGDADGGEQCAADLRAYAAKCRDIGAVLRLGTVTPRASGSMTAGVKAAILRINAAIREMGELRLCVVFDAFSSLVDPASADGAARDGLLIDTVHPNSRGAYYIGREAAARFTDLHDNIVAPSSNADSRLTNASSLQLVANPKCSGTGGTVGSGGSGACAASWSLNRQSGSALTVAGAVNVADPDTSVLGRVWQKMTFGGTVASGTEIVRFQQTVTLASLAAAVVPGTTKIDKARCRLRTNGLSANIQYIRMTVEMLNATPAVTYSSNGMADSAYQQTVFHSEEGVLECPAGFVIPADTVSVRVTVNVAFGVGACAGDVFVTDVDVSVDD